ncbi:MAG: GntR family transcriptional regulator [Chloroflexi bacterium]|nr:GntR family transcriptional regulator [Chloroflexota bacterium]
MSPRVAAEDLSAVLPRIETVDLTSQIQDLVRERILHGDLQPDQVISARVLGQALGVSMTPVRNALDRLAGEGLVVMSPRRGTRVAAPTVEDLEECYDLRLVLEGHAAERAARRLTDAELAELERRWAAFGVGIPPLPPGESLSPQANREAVRELIALDRAFHEFIIEVSGSRRLAQLYRGLELSLAVGRLYYLGEGAYIGRTSHAQHRAMLDALATRDPAKARAAAEEHVRQARVGMLNAVRAREQQRHEVTEAIAGTDKAIEAIEAIEATVAAGDGAGA